MHAITVKIRSEWSLLPWEYQHWRMCEYRAGVLTEILLYRVNAFEPPSYTNPDNTN